MAESGKRVSVVIPYYNGKEFIEETIASALDQTCGNVEVIVVDDCSPSQEDSDYLQSLTQKYPFKLIRLKYNLGTASAIAHGYENATGDYIAVLGHDDLFVKDKMEKQVKFLEENPSMLCVFSGMEEFSNKHTKVLDLVETIDMLKDLGQQDEKTFLKKLFVEGVSPSLYIQTFLVRRDFALQELVQIWHKSKADVFPIKIHLCRYHLDKIGLINEPLTRYRVHDTNISHNKYKMFDLMMDTIMNMCPKEYQTQAIARILPLLNDAQKLVRKQKRYKKLSGVLTALIPVKSWRKKARAAFKAKAA